MSKLIIVFLMFGFAGCSNKDLYDNLHLNQRQLCDKEPRSTYDECIKSLSKSYKKYELERKELLEKQKTDE